MPIDTLAFAERFEGAGFGHYQARAAAAAFGMAHDAGRDELATKGDLDLRLAELEGRLNKQTVELEGRLNKQLSELEVRLTRQIGEVGKELSGRLWSTITIIAGVSTAISATIGAGVALILKWGGI